MTTNKMVEDVNISRLNKSAQTLVRVAVQVGWKATPTPGGGVRLASTFEPGQTINVPAQSNINANRMRGWTNKALRYGDPVQVAVLAAHVTDGGLGLEQMQNAGAEPGSPILAPPDTTPAEFHSTVEVEPEPHVVSERPWMANQTTSGKSSRKYPSPTTVERKWSDGTLDYACAKPDCDFSDPVPQRVAGHWRRAKGHEKVEPPTPDQIMRAEPYVPKSSTNEQRVRRLKHELWAALDNLKEVARDGSREELAEALAKKIIEARDRRNEREDHEQQPLTPEEILERIRGLVDDGSYLRRLNREREMEDELETLRAEQQALAERAEVAERERDSIKGEWNTLAELIANKGGST